MRVQTHLLCSILCLILFLDYYSINNPIIFSLIVLFITVAVDIDEDHSTFGKKVWPLAKIIKATLGHRGIFHSLLIPLLLYLVLNFFNQQEAAIAVVLGYVSHLGMDMLTPQGVRIFYPLPGRIRGPIRVGSMYEHILALFMCLWIVLLLI